MPNVRGEPARQEPSASRTCADSTATAYMTWLTAWGLLSLLSGVRLRQRACSPLLPGLQRQRCCICGLVNVGACQPQHAMIPVLHPPSCLLWWLLHAKAGPVAKLMLVPGPQHLLGHARWVAPHHLEAALNLLVAPLGGSALKH